MCLVSEIKEFFLLNYFKTRVASMRFLLSFLITLNLKPLKKSIDLNEVLKFKVSFYKMLRLKILKYFHLFFQSRYTGRYTGFIKLCCYKALEFSFP